MSKNTVHFNPFFQYSQQLNNLLQQAKNNENPAWFLYKNGGRNIIFMLEGLTRLHQNALEDSKMEKWYNRFKRLEDLIGQIDYLDAFKTQFEANKTVDAAALTTLTEKTNASVAELNKRLAEKFWFEDKLSKFDAFILETDLKYNEKYAAKIRKTYKKEVDEIIDFAKELKYNFKIVEDELHEMRRKLRWLSIYPQAMCGMFQFDRQATNPDWSAKYMTEKIVNSPFNKLPAVVDGLSIIALDYHCFIALSYVIQEFGALKDKGLQTIVLTTELGYSPKKAKQTSGENYTEETTILSDASKLLLTFFEDKILKNLVK
ncbi:MAG: hypothetical protein RLZZ292_2909 [Bacteroidota bacterium]|jgi:hypothetical protein